MGHVFSWHKPGYNGYEMIISLQVLEKCVFASIRQEENFQYLVSSKHIIVLRFVLLKM